jgi:hypothetical protein
MTAMARRRSAAARIMINCVIVCIIVRALDISVKRPYKGVRACLAAADLLA